MPARKKKILQEPSIRRLSQYVVNFDPAATADAGAVFRLSGYGPGTTEGDRAAARAKEFLDEHWSTVLTLHRGVSLYGLRALVFAHYEIDGKRVDVLWGYNGPGHNPTRAATFGTEEDLRKLDHLLPRDPEIPVLEGPGIGVLACGTEKIVRRPCDRRAWAKRLPDEWKIKGTIIKTRAARAPGLELHIWRACAVHEAEIRVLGRKSSRLASVIGTALDEKSAVAEAERMAIECGVAYRDVEKKRKS